MYSTSLSRRHLLRFLGASAGLAFIPRSLASNISVIANPKFTYCLNTATIRGHKLGLMRELELVSKAGFGSIEIWMDTLTAYLDSGGTLAEVKNRLNNLGLKIESAIGFAPWIVDDDNVRKKGIELLKREMELLAALGCKRTAAPPVGATDKPGLDLDKAAERYRVILELGEQTGVIPQLELWGFSANLNRLSELLYVAAQSGHPEAKVLLDNYHLYKGGTNINSLKLLNPDGIEVFHVNDYPATLTPEKITDADRIYPGDGAAPIRQVLTSLQHSARPLVISFEVFNKNYYSQDPLQVLQTSLAKMKKVTEGI